MWPDHLKCRDAPPTLRLEERLNEETYQASQENLNFDHGMPSVENANQK